MKWRCLADARPSCLPFLVSDWTSPVNPVTFSFSVFDIAISFYPLPTHRPPPNHPQSATPNLTCLVHIYLPVLIDITLDLAYVVQSRQGEQRGSRESSAWKES